MRATQHQLALARAEAQTQVSTADQMQMVLTDARRENKILSEEVHELNSKLKSVSLESRPGSSTAPLSGPCRRGTNKGLMVSMRVQVDHAKTRASRLEQEKAVFSKKLGRRWL